MNGHLKEKRRQIDVLDTELSGLLAERLLLAASMAGLKKKDRDLRREALVLERVTAPIKGRALRAAVRTVYRELIRQGRLLQAAASATEQ